MSEPIITLDLGYSGTLRLTILFTDQNGQYHSRGFEVAVFGEKPTCLTLTQAGVVNQVIYSTTENDPQHMAFVEPLNTRIRKQADQVWELGKETHDRSFELGQRIKALASEMHQVAREIEKS